MNERMNECINEIVYLNYLDSCNVNFPSAACCNYRQLYTVQTKPLQTSQIDR